MLPVFSAAGTWNPPDDFFIAEKESAIKKDSVSEKSPWSLTAPVKVIAGVLVRFYQEYISAHKKSSCPMHPNCSRFCNISIAKYGFTGLLMTVDRIYYRENSMMDRFYLLKEIDGQFKFYDPPEANYIFTKRTYK